MDTARRPSTSLRLALLCGLAALVYAGAVPSDFALDDAFAVQSNPVVQGQVPAWEAFSRDFWGLGLPSPIGTYRPLTVLSFVLDARLGNGAPWVFHLTNVLLHVLAVAALYRVWRSWAGDTTAWAAAALFTLLAAPAEAVQAIVGRADLLGALLGLLGYAAHRTPGARGAWSAALCFALALLSKESALLYPLVWCVLEGLRTRAWRPSAWGRLGVYPLLAALFLLARKRAVGTYLSAGVGNLTNPLVSAPGPQRLLGAAAIFWSRYLGGLANPLRRLSLCSAPACGPVGPGEPRAWLGLGALVLLAALAVGCWRSAPLVSAGLVWFLALFLPISNLLVVGPSVYGERLLYAPLMGGSLALAAAVALLAARLPRPGLAWGLLGALGVGNAVAIQLRHESWRDSASLALQDVEEEPRSSEAQGMAASAWMVRGDPVAAERCAREAIALEPSYGQFYGLLAAALDLQGRTAEAQRVFERSVELNPSEEAVLNLARFHANHGERQRALELLEHPRLPHPPGPRWRALLRQLREAPE